MALNKYLVITKQPSQKFVLRSFMGGSVEEVRKRLSNYGLIVDLRPFTSNKELEMRDVVEKLNIEMVDGYKQARRKEVEDNLTLQLAIYFNMHEESRTSTPQEIREQAALVKRLREELIELA